MVAPNRAEKFAKLHRVLKKHFEAIPAAGSRSLLENLLFACCLENSKFEAANEAFARLQQDFFDWNEVRVTTAQELAEVMNGLFDPNDAALRLKRTLHSVFETHYSFEIDSLKKENLGKAVQHIAKFNGISPFVVGYATQNSLGGHAIAVDRALLALLQTLDLVSDKDIAQSQVPGLERAIPKNKGGEFFSLVHQLAAGLLAAPFNSDLRNIVLEVDRDAKDRLPKRGVKRPAPPPPSPLPPPIPTSPPEPTAKKVKPASVKPTEPPKKKPATPGVKKPQPATKKPSPKPAKGPPPKNPIKKSSAAKQLARKKPR
jgi:endonuclease-3